MIIKASFIKSFLCLTLCVALIWGSINFGQYVSASSDGFFGELNNSDSNENLFNITGFGGGGYQGVQVSATPTDIETLKKQTEKLYKNYKKTGTVKEQKMGVNSFTVKYNNLLFDNKTDEKINIKNYLAKQVKYGEITTEEPYILIYHTHTTEGYEMLDLGWYSDSYNSRTKDKSKNMVRVGDALTESLEKQGFKVIHDREIYDSAYNDAYSRSRVGVEKYLKKYPSIKITLDVHRDAIHYEGNVRGKPTAEVNGKKAAQVMIISGCEGGNVKKFSSWRDNLVFALDFQNAVQNKYDGLMRPLYFSYRKYNMDLTPCSLLLEFGTDANTLEEAVYSAELIGESLGEMLKEEMKKGK